MDSTHATGERGPARWRIVAAHVAAVVVLVTVATGVVLLMAQRGSLGPVPPRDTPEALLRSEAFTASRAMSALLFAAAGWYLTTRRPHVLFGPLALAAGLGNGLAVLGGQVVVFSQLGGHHLPAVSIAAWFFAWGLSVEPLAVVTIDVLFPDGRLPAGRLRWLGLLSIALCAAGLAHSITGPFGVGASGPLAGLRNPLGLAVLPGLNDGVLIGPGLLLGSVVLVVRWLRASGESRRVLRSLAVVTIVSLGLTPFLQDGVGPTVIGTVVVVITLGVVITGVLRHHVYGIELVLNRTLVYALLTAVVAAVYGLLVAVVSLAGTSFGGVGFLPALGAAFCLLPAHSRVQRLVNRFLYGQRDEPYAVVAGIGARLEETGATDRLLPELLQSVASTLRLPYAALELRSDDGAVRRIGSGSPTDATDRFPLIHQGRRLGDLLVGRRTGQTAVAAGERRLLEAIARQAAVAVSNVMLTEELLRSRERIVNTAEEERLRLRRDLHDGLGPLLTAAATRVDASRNLLRRDPDRADQVMRDVRSDITTALDDLRRLVYALRPPALDELGLLGALREHILRSPLPVVLQGPDSLPDLPPAVEVAAYRVVAEALTNVSRHAGASRCTVLIGCGDTLSIDISDDGTGTCAWTPGVGLSSIRERTSQLGGRWTAGPHPEGGGTVHIELPVSLGRPAA